MPTNLELKAVVESPVRVNAILKRKARRDGVLMQTDTYFAIHDGRLKVREFLGAGAELIYYKREERNGSRWSNYEVIPLTDGARIKVILSKLFPIRVIVKKRRQLYLYKNARIHLDDVEGLGQFIEFEVIVKSGKRQAHTVYTQLRELLNIQDTDIIKCSYADLMEQQLKSRHPLTRSLRTGVKRG